MHAQHGERTISADDPCPVQALGMQDGRCTFLTSTRLTMQLSAEELTHLPNLIALFAGDDRWLRRNFPRQLEVVADRAGGGRVVHLGIDRRAAAQHLVSLIADVEAEACTAVTAAAAASIRPRGWLATLLGRMGAIRRAGP